MKTVLVLIVLLLAGIAGLLYIKLTRDVVTWDNVVTWDMDPARVIVPVDRPAQLSAAGDLNSAYFELEFRANEIERGYDEAGVDPNELTGIWVNFDAAAVTLLINSLTLYFSTCFVDEDPSDIAYDRIACDDEGDEADPTPIWLGARDLAKAMWLEANGWNSDTVATLYTQGGSRIGSVLAGGAITHDDPGRRQVAALAKDFASARVLRLLLMTDGPDAEPPSFDAVNQWCRSDRDEICPGALSTYRAIKLYLTGHHGDARTTALAALKGRQPWVYRSPYEHPLLWILAASRYVDEDDTGDLQPLIDAALTEWPEDAQTALLAYVDPEAHDGTSALPDACDTPGCRFFLAQFYETNGDMAAAEVANDAGLDLCRTVRSIPCTALRLAGSGTATAVSR